MKDILCESFVVTFFGKTFFQRHFKLASVGNDRFSHRSAWLYPFPGLYQSERFLFDSEDAFLLPFVITKKFAWSESPSLPASPCKMQMGSCRTWILIPVITTRSRSKLHPLRRDTRSQERSWSRLHHILLSNSI